MGQHGYLHNVGEGDHVVAVLGDLRHERGRRTPGVVGGRLPDLDLPKVNTAANQ